MRLNPESLPVLWAAVLCTLLSTGMIAYLYAWLVFGPVWDVLGPP